MKRREVRIGKVRLANDLPLAVIAGPCVVETEARTMETARAVRDAGRRLGMPVIFKCSYDKANRSSGSSYRGPGVREGLEILARVKKRFGMPLLVDVHSPEEAAVAAAVADVLQIPAFLCRQTDLLVAAARTGKVVNVKKGQFVSPWEAGQIVKKIEAAGNRNVMLTERGASFGYNNLIVDMRSLAVLKSFGVPVVFDATHSVQLPGARGDSSGGQREFIYPLSRAAAAVGVAAVFMEVHPKPEIALSDGPNAVRLRQLPEFLKRLRAVDRVVKNFDPFELV